MLKKKIPMALLCGYLGAGKTTLLNRVLSNQEGYKVAVIVNDIGEVNVDARLIKDGAKIEDTSSIVPLTNGCICCTLKSALAQGIEDIIKTGKFDYIMIEASGVCEPLPIAQELELIQNGRLDNVVGVVDTARMVEEFDSGDALLKKDIDEEDIESLLVQQVEFCSTLIINKIDLVSEEQLKKVRAVVNTIHPNVRIIETTKGDVPVSEILATGRFDFEEVYMSAGWCKALTEHDAHGEDEDEHDEHSGEHRDAGSERDEHDHSHCDHEHGHCEHEHNTHDGEHDGEAHEHKHSHHHHHDHEHKHVHREDGATEDEYGIGTFIYYRRKPFDRLKLDELASRWPRSIIRSKGIMWFNDEPDVGLVLESSGRQIMASYSGPWLAALPKREQEKAFKEDPEIKKDWDEKVGDRMIKICIIGKDMNREEIKAQLDAALAD